MVELAEIAIGIITILAAAGGLGLLIALVLIHAGADRSGG